jgi:serine/threonine protein kinase
MEFPRVAVLLPRHQRYKLVMSGQGGAVGAGSFGCACLAIDRITKTRVAVKRQNRLRNRETGREFLTYQRLSLNPCMNVLPLSDYSLEKDTFYTVHELCDGDLWLYFQYPLVQRGGFDDALVRRHLHGVCTGVAHLHGLGITHGDLNMKNLLINHDGVVKVADHGAAFYAHGPYLLSKDDEITTSYVRA